MENHGNPQEYFERGLDNFFQPLFASPLPNDRKYSRSHVWIKNDSSTSATLGIDHVGAYFMRPVVSVVLPQTPSRVEQNSPFAWLVVREGTIALRAAVSGIGSESNALLLEHPYLLLDDPYASGWVLRIDHANKNGVDLLDSDDFTPLFHKEMAAIREKFINAFSKMQPAVGATLYDGGEPLTGIAEIIGQRKYFDIISRFFSKI
jgi:glycine cleavage system H protein